MSGKRIAFVVGIGNYQHVNKLEYCPLSAKDVYEILIDPSYGGCDPTLSSLKMAVGEDDLFNKYMFDQILDKTIRDVGTSDQFIFYFIGHGEILGNNLYLMVTDSVPGKKTTSISFNSLVEKVDTYKAIYIVDACHSEAMFKSTKNLQSVDWEKSAMKTYEEDFQQTTEKGIGFLSASSTSQLASQDDTLKRTLFSYYFCEGIKGWKKEDELVSLDSIQTYINHKIRKNHFDKKQDARIQLIGAAQVPWISYNPKYKLYLQEKEEKQKKDREKEEKDKEEKFKKRVRDILEISTNSEISDEDRWDLNVQARKIGIQQQRREELILEVQQEFSTKESDPIKQPTSQEPIQNNQHSEKMYRAFLEIAYSDRIITLDERLTLDRHVQELQLSKERATELEKEVRSRLKIQGEIQSTTDLLIETIRKSGIVEQFVKEQDGVWFKKEWNDFLKSIENRFGKKVETEEEKTGIGGLLESYKKVYLEDKQLAEERKRKEELERKKAEEQRAIEEKKRQEESERKKAEEYRQLLDRVKKSGEIEKFTYEKKGNWEDYSISILQETILNKYGAISTSDLKGLLEKAQVAYIEEQRKLEAERKPKLALNEPEQPPAGFSLVKPSLIEIIRDREIISKFIQEKKGNWNHEDWLDIRYKVHQQFGTVDDSELGWLLEQQKLVYQSKAVKVQPGRTYKNSLNMEFIYIPPGEFMMGASQGDSEAGDDEKPAHKVKITKGFYMGKYPVTQKQWKDIMGNNPSSFKDRDNYPVEQVSWDDIQKFIEKLNNVPPEGDPSVSRLQAGKYRLPTEAEWEYAARAGSTTKYYFGDDASKLGEYAWFDDNSFIDKENRGTHPVGQKKPNQFGLYDMLGNVWEWVEDRFDENYYKQFENSTAVDPKGSHRVIRGGSWYRNPVFCRVSFRYYWFPEDGHNNIGFRLVLSL